MGLVKRPKYSPSDWAENEDYVAPTKAWDTRPTKVQPSHGKQLEGFEPNERPPAEYLNWLLNHYSEHLKYLDGIQAKNWSHPHVISNQKWELTGLEHFPICYDTLSGLYWACGPEFGVGTTPEVYFSWNGEYWESTGHSASHDSVGMASGLSGFVCNILSNNRIQLKSFSGGPAAWANHDVATASAFKGGEYDPYEICFWFFGQGSDTHPGIWSAPENLTPITKRTLDTPGSGAGYIDFASFGDGKGVICGQWNDGAGNIPQLWYRSGDETASWTKVGSQVSIFGGFNCVGVTYDSANDIFVAFAANGAVWSSPTGAVWHMEKAANANQIWWPNCIAANGSLIMGVAQCESIDSTLMNLYYSTDIGAT